MGRQRITLATMLERVAARPSLLEIPGDALLTVEETAAYLALSPSTIEKWINGERWLSVRLPVYHRLHPGPKSPIRFMVSDLRDWLRECRIEIYGEDQTPARCA